MQPNLMASLTIESSCEIDFCGSFNTKSLQQVQLPPFTQPPPFNPNATEIVGLFNSVWIQNETTSKWYKVTPGDKTGQAFVLAHKQTTTRVHRLVMNIQLWLA